MSISTGFSDKAEQSVNEHPPLFAPGFMAPFVLVTALFLFWGIPSNMNDILIKQFMKSFELTRFRAGLIQSAFYMGYFLLAMPAALIMRKYSYKTGLVIGLLLYSAGTFLFWPAAIHRQYGFFLFALFVIASGASFLETGANPFIVVLGDPRTSERRLNFSQAFNPVGAVTSVLVGTIFILSGIELKPDQVVAMRAEGTYNAYLQAETMRVVKPYLVIGTVMFIWAMLILRTKFPKIAEEAEEGPEREKGRFVDLFKHRHFVLGVVAQFLYVGAYAVVDQPIDKRVVSVGHGCAAGLDGRKDIGDQLGEKRSEVDAPIRPVTGERVDLVHQRFGARGRQAEQRADDGDADNAGVVHGQIELPLRKKPGQPLAR